MLERRSIVTATLALGFVLAVPAGCRRTRTEAVAMIPKGTTHEFWKFVHAGAEKAAAETGTKVIWKGPLREDDREDQIKIVETFVNMGVKGILLAPLDDTALVPVVGDAVRSQVPVLIFDSSFKGQGHVSFVATDNYLGGRLAAQHLAKALDGRGKVMVLRYAEGSASTGEREQGFLDAIADWKAIEVVSKNQYAGATTETAFKASENLLIAHREGGRLTVQGIFCPNESTAFGMLRALEDGGHAGQVKLVGFDSSQKVVDALKQGHMDATVVQDPLGMGYLAVTTMVRHLRGEKVAARIDTGATLVTRDNMDEPRSRELLLPDYRKWLKEE